MFVNEFKNNVFTMSDLILKFVLTTPQISKRSAYTIEIYVLLLKPYLVIKLIKSGLILEWK